MKKLFLVLGFLFIAKLGFSANLFSNTSYYYLQHYKVVKDTYTEGEVTNKFYHRGDFYIVHDSFTVQVADITPYLILYSTGTIWAKTIETTNFNPYSTNTTVNNMTVSEKLEALELNLTQGCTIETTLNTGGKHWELVFSSSTLTPGTTFSATGLDGDTDIIYKFVYRVISGTPTTTLTYMSFNNDTAQNYGYNNIYASGGGAPASEVSTTSQGIVVAVTAATSHVSMIEGTLYAKSGYGRTVTGIMQNRTVTSTKTIGYSYFTTGVWSNTGDNITSITIWGSTPNAFGVGSYFEIWRKH